MKQHDEEVAAKLVRKNNAPQRFVAFNLNSLNKLLTFNFFTHTHTDIKTTTKNNKRLNNKIIILLHSHTHLYCYTCKCVCNNLLTMKNKEELFHLLFKDFQIVFFFSFFVIHIFPS